MIRERQERGRFGEGSFEMKMGKAAMNEIILLICILPHWREVKKEEKEIQRCVGFSRGSKKEAGEED